MPWKIAQERWRCIGCGACAAVCDKFWEMASDGKAQLKGAIKTKTKDGELLSRELPEPGCNTTAADVCPVRAISLTKA